jgi:Tol biopolymer transport system component
MLRLPGALGMTVGLLVACDGPEAPRGGAIAVRAVPAGSEVVARGLRVLLDGVSSADLEGAEPRVLAPVPAGDHLVELTALPATCAAVDGDKARRVAVVENDTTHVEFAVECNAIGGALQVSVLTEGEELDPSGYDVVVDGTVVGSVSTAGALTVSLAPGARAVHLGEMTPNCLIEGGSPREIMIHPGGVTAVEFSVSCSLAAPAGHAHELALVTLREGEPDFGGQFGSHVYLINDDGTGVRPLETSGLIRYESPEWSPDGTRLVLSGTRSTEVLSDLYVLTLATGAPVLLPNTRGGRHPAWSRDGGRIAFLGEPELGSEAVLVVDADGLNPLRLDVDFGSNTADYPTWSPDGDRIGFVRNDFNEFEEVTAEIRVFDLRDSTQMLLYTAESVISDLVWSPDGQSMAFTQSEDIYVLDVRNPSTPRRLTAGQARSYSPKWAPDGARLTFVSDRDGDEEVYVMNSDGTGVARVTNSPGPDQDPAWRP